MEKTMRYRDLNHALKWFRVQVSVGIPWALENMPKLNSVQKVWDYLKARTIYKNDPQGKELFQKIQTLLTSDNYHGIVGAGDCDCFSIAALSTLIANGFTNCGIVLAGRNPLVPVHIWVYVIDNGKKYNFDLTCKKLDKIRPYPFTQSIPYVLNQKEKNMLLQLAENSGGSHIWMPSLGVKVREDVYDNLSAAEFQRTMLSEGHAPEYISELSSKRSQRRAENKQKQLDKVEVKATRAAVKTERKANKPINIRRAEKVTAKATKRTVNADTRNVRAQGNATAKTFRNQAKVINAQNAPLLPQSTAPDSSSYAVPNFPIEAVEPEIEYYEAEEIPNEEPQEKEPVFTDLIDFNGISELGGVSVPPFGKVLIITGLGLSLGYISKRIF
jgi:hypothetical protein